MSAPLVFLNRALRVTTDSGKRNEHLPGALT